MPEIIGFKRPRGPRKWFYYGHFANARNARRKADELRKDGNMVRLQEQVFTGAYHLWYKPR